MANQNPVVQPAKPEDTAPYRLRKSTPPAPYEVKEVKEVKNESPVADISEAMARDMVHEIYATQDAALAPRKLSEVDTLRLRAAVAEMDASNAVVGALEIQVRLTPQWQALERERQVQAIRARALDDLRAKLAHSYGLPPEAQVNPQTGEITA